MSYDNRVYYEDQSDWQPGERYYYLWRYLDKMFCNVKGRESDEITALDLSRMSENTLYLMKHLLILMGRFEQMLADFPNLRGLREVPDSGRTIFLSRRPTFVYDYFTEKRIFL